MKTSDISINRFNHVAFKTVGAFVFLLTTGTVLFPFWGFSQNKLEKNSSQNLLEQFVQSKGESVISFDSSNIKQFWTDKTVSSKDNAIEITLQKDKDNTYKSLSLPIQLANANETFDCKVDIITSNKDLSFSITNRKGKVLSMSVPDDDFIQYHIITSSFHLEDTDSFLFHLSFASTNSTVIIQKIVLSFQSNPQSAFLGSTGFKSLLETINDTGIQVSNGSVRYIIAKEYNCLFIRIPKDKMSIPTCFYHVYPKDKSDLLPDRVKYNFNNYDFRLDNKKCIVPEAFPGNSEYFIIKCDLPKYPYSHIELGQFEKDKRIWTIGLKEESPAKE